MFVKHKIFIGLSDVTPKKELSNTSLLKFLEDVAGMHSDMAGYGLTDIERTRKSWILLSWKVEVKKRPLVNDTLYIKTWSKSMDKLYAYRDFEVRNQYDEIICIATSKWILLDIDTGKIIKLTDDIKNAYKQETDTKVFEETDMGKLTEPQDIISKTDYKITRSMIDINKHLHNIYYLDIAKEALPEEVAFEKELNEFEIMYKKEIKLGETVKAIYSKQNEYHYVVLKNENESVLHAIIKLK